MCLLGTGQAKGSHASGSGELAGRKCRGEKSSQKSPVLKTEYLINVWEKSERILI